MKIWVLAATLAFAWLANPVSANGDPAAGKAKAATCAACHGADGKAIMPAYPNLSGQHASYIAKQLTDYREGHRTNALMSSQATNLSDDDILDLAAYFSSLPLQPGVSAEENLELGRDIYRGGIASAGVAACTACHGPTGLGNPGAQWPVTSGQNAQYTADQLKYFRTGERSNDPNSMMQAIAKRMTDAEIEAVANYMQGLYGTP